MKAKRILFSSLLFFSCNGQPTEDVVVKLDSSVEIADTATDISILPKDTPEVIFQPLPVNTGKASREELVAYARTLKGIPYKYASTDPAQGFDCSGFITYVFNHFNIAVPRSSVDFTNVGKEVNLRQAQTGDLILFTGTDSTIRVVGHMGIVLENTDSLRFIHSTSGKADGVTITALNKYYLGRFVKVVDIFGN